MAQQEGCEEVGNGLTGKEKWMQRGISTTPLRNRNELCWTVAESAKEGNEEW